MQKRGEQVRIFIPLIAESIFLNSIFALKICHNESVSENQTIFQLNIETFILDLKIWCLETLLIEMIPLCLYIFYISLEMKFAS